MKELKSLAMLLALAFCLSACAGGGDVSTPTTERSAASRSAVRLGICAAGSFISFAYFLFP